MFGKASLAKAAQLFGLAGFALGASITASAAQQPFNWTGFYVGAHGAYNWTTTEFPYENPYVAPPAPSNGSGPPRQSLDGAMVGGQMGVNYQMGMFVVGAEADISKGKLNSSARDGNYIVETDTIDMTATLRGRVGVAVGHFLPYLTGGIMWERATRGQSCPDKAAVPFGHCSREGPYDVSQQQWHHGLVWGGGVEYALTKHISLKFEALRMRQAEVSYVLGPTATGKVANSSTMDYETTTARFGVNYRF